MSYEPTLIISKEDLHNKADLIRAYFINKPPTKKDTDSKKQKWAAHIELDEALNYEGFTIKGNAFVIIKPELTSHNAAVRKALHDLNIEFAVHN